MLKYYKRIIEFYIDDHMVTFYTYYNYDIFSQFPESKIIKLNWDNVLDFIKEQNGLPFEIRKTRKGLKLYFCGCPEIVKQWKKDLNMAIKITYEEYTPSIKEIINYYDGDKAIQYLVERGLNISNLK